MNKKRKVVLIIGGLGQYVSYMADSILKKDYKVICISSQIYNKKNLNLFYFFNLQNYQC